MRHLSRSLALLFALAAAPLGAHELLSVSLRLVEAQPGAVQAILKTPLARDGSPVTVVPRFTPDCASTGIARVERQPEAVLREWRLDCAGGLAGRRLRIEGLDPRTPDAIVTLRLADGAEQTHALDRHDPEAVLGPAVSVAGPPPELRNYLPIGIEHILLGPDHLLFVLGLMLVVYAAGSGLRMLVAALTAFTVAHSLTLALAVLGIWGLPARVVELLIALSIVLLAIELARHQAGRGVPSLTLRKPWLVAFVFGLLHGFGFAGALAQVGLPDAARAWALLLFNLGVEIGQLIFVAATLLLFALLRRPGRRPATTTAAVTLLGGIATYWALDRLLSWSAHLWIA